MYKSGDVVVYGRDVYRIKDVKDNYLFNKIYEDKRNFEILL